MQVYKSHSPGCVAAVCKRKVSNAQLVHGAQCGQTAVNWVPALNANQTSGLILGKNVLYICDDKIKR